MTPGAALRDSNKAARTTPRTTDLTNHGDTILQGKIINLTTANLVSLTNSEHLIVAYYSRNKYKRKGKCQSYKDIQENPNSLL